MHINRDDCCHCKSLGTESTIAHVSTSSSKDSSLPHCLGKYSRDLGGTTEGEVQHVRAKTQLEVEVVGRCVNVVWVVHRQQPRRVQVDEGGCSVYQCQQILRNARPAAIDCSKGWEVRETYLQARTRAPATTADSTATRANQSSHHRPAFMWKRAKKRARVATTARTMATASTMVVTIDRSAAEAFSSSLGAMAGIQIGSLECPSVSHPGIPGLRTEARGNGSFSADSPLS